MKRPLNTEYVDYYDRYIRLVPDGDIVAILARQIEETLQVLAALPEARASYRYAVDKWSIKEVVGHVVDVERVFAYRALMFARNAPDPQPAIEQDDLVRYANFDQRTLPEICDEFQFLRRSNLVLFRSFDDQIEMRRGLASGFEFTVRAIPYIIAGHELHHMRIIKECYLRTAD